MFKYEIISLVNTKNVMLPIKKRKNAKKDIELSKEQQYFIEKALEGNNILVDACIGSGKTTSIQKLCDELTDKSVLYLTYNKLLKIDAKSKIKNKNVMVTNYHGFASWILFKNNISFGYSDSVTVFVEKKLPIPRYDVLIIDEYQDIETELAEMLEYIKENNPGIQIIAVGDMEQKIYDKTTLNVMEFIKPFLGEYLEIEFTKCFRISAELAEMLGRIWNKNIDGANENCEVVEMTTEDVVEYLKDKKPCDILCLGSRSGGMTSLLNKLEEEQPDIFNKKSVYASIRTQEGGATQPNKNSAVFTTFDACKGMEKPICIIYDWTYDYWQTRLHKPDTSYEILRNIFCVAASRGKDKIIFVVDNNDMLLTEEDLLEPGDNGKSNDVLMIDSMFDFKYKEDIDEAYKCLNIKRIDIPLEKTGELAIRDKDELIDLLPCIGIYQKAVYFEKYKIDDQIKIFLNANPDYKHLYDGDVKKTGLDEKILFLVSLMTRHNRYRTQVRLPLVSYEERQKLTERLSVVPKDANVQLDAEIIVNDEKGNQKLSLVGLGDCVLDECYYSIKYLYSISNVDFLVCACYSLALDTEKGILWNIHDNSQYEISITNKKIFMDKVVNAITKGKMKSVSSMRLDGVTKFAVIDTETNYDDEVISIGVVVAEVKEDKSEFEAIDKRYYIITPECLKLAMFSSQLEHKKVETHLKSNRKDVLKDIATFLQDYGIENIFAYNASFDYHHLPELKNMCWYDIMGVAAYKQYNYSIKKREATCSTGRLLTNYGVEPILNRLLACSTNVKKHYYEIHNALTDAIDELHVMQMLDLPLYVYNIAIINEDKPNHDELLRINSIQKQVDSKRLLQASKEKKNKEKKLKNRIKETYIAWEPVLVNKYSITNKFGAKGFIVFLAEINKKENKHSVYVSFLKNYEILYSQYFEKEQGIIEIQIYDDESYKSMIKKIFLKTSKK